LAGRRRGFFGFIEVWDNVNPFLGNSHLDVFGFLGMAEGNPGSYFVKSTDGANTAKDETHHAANEVAVVPAGGLESGPKVAIEASFAGLSVVQEKPIGAGYSIIVKVVDEGDFEFKSGLIDGGRQARKNVVNLPKIEMANLLVASQSLSHGKVVESAEGGLNFIHDVSPE
jgi:hypothetical protein